MSGVDDAHIGRGRAGGVAGEGDSTLAASESGEVVDDFGQSSAAGFTYNTGLTLISLFDE